jgi:hypothetical protein
MEGNALVVYTHGLLQVFVAGWPKAWRLVDKAAFLVIARP